MISWKMLINWFIRFCLSIQSFLRFLSVWSVLLRKMLFFLIIFFFFIFNRLNSALWSVGYLNPIISNLVPWLFFFSFVLLYSPWSTWKNEPKRTHELIQSDNRLPIEKLWFVFHERKLQNFIELNQWKRLMGVLLFSF